MKRVPSYVAFFGALVASATIAASSRGQSSPIPFDEALTTSAFQAAPIPEVSAGAPRVVAAGKPTVMVMGFESGTVTAQAREKRGFLGGKSEGERYEPSELGTGIADMLIEKLLESGEFRVLERKPLAPGSGAQFIITGSVTKFGFEENNFGGLAASVATMGLLSFKQHKTRVTLTARVINAATGEIVASMSSDGLSRKGGGLRVAGIGSNGFGGADINSANFRATAIGEATERAVSQLSDKMVRLKASF